MPVHLGLLKTLEVTTVNVGLIRIVRHGFILSLGSTRRTFRKKYREEGITVNKRQVTNDNPDLHRVEVNEFNRVR